MSYATHQTNPTLLPTLDAQVFDANFITLATRAMLGGPAKAYNISLIDIDYVAVKARDTHTHTVLFFFLFSVRHACACIRACMHVRNGPLHP